MSKPYLIVVTGRPGSGKTTLAKGLSDAFCMPLLSRDQIKEGYVHTLGKSHEELPQEANGVASKIFFDTIGGLLRHQVSVIVEAAFQHHVWASNVEQFKDQAQMSLLICKIEDELAHDRYLERGLRDHAREYFHGDKGVELARKGLKAEVAHYEAPRVDVPTFYIDTTDGYEPSIQKLKKMILNDG